MKDLTKLPRRFKRHISVTQSIIGVMTGFITIVGASYSAYRYLNPAEDRGRLEAVIQTAETGGPASGATVEILSNGKALVATLQADANGRLSHPLKEGRYNVRFKREGFGDVTREIEVIPGQNVELTIRLPSKGLGNTMKKIIGR